MHFWQRGGYFIIVDITSYTLKTNQTQSKQKKINSIVSSFWGINKENKKIGLEKR